MINNQALLINSNNCFSNAESTTTTCFCSCVFSSFSPRLRAKEMNSLYCKSLSHRTKIPLFVFRQFKSYSHKSIYCSTLGGIRLVGWDCRSKREAVCFAETRPKSSPILFCLFSSPICSSVFLGFGK